MVVPASDEILVQKIDSLQMQTGRYCSPFFGIAVLFFNIFFMELTHMWLLSLLSLNSYAPKLNRVVTVVTDLSRFLHYVYTRDGGTLPDQAPDSKSDPPPIDAGSDVPGLAHSTEGLGLCDTAVQVEVCSGRKWVHIHTHTRTHTHAHARTNFQIKSEPNHPGTWSTAAWPPRRQCHRPAVFFRHYRLSSLPFPKYKFQNEFKSVMVSIFYCSKIA